MVRRTKDSRQGDLMGLLERLHEEPPAPDPGTLHVDARLRAALSGALKRFAGDRFEVAARMSRLMDVEVTRWQLDAWTAESKDGHRFPAAYLPAFCVAVGDWTALELLADASGQTLSTDRDVDVAAQVGRLEAQIRREEAELREKRAQLRRAVKTWQSKEDR